ncbi:hypothetical protein [Clostridium sp.]|uniref:hypothetical protein n=1 Tax=Clostridium sp. TaxID=1506 RepID=UPI0028482DF7|nr:hypothetical protein [Clostridium sp.]MDR3594240.1 hypothetical protein [Clostridium sp.]
MIKDTVSYKGETIITTYHRGFDLELYTRKFIKIEKLGHFNLKFEEIFVEEEDIKNIENWHWKIEGVLDTNNSMNPYKESACARMEQFVSLAKPKCLFHFKDKYMLKIDIETFKQICDFTRKYVGIDFIENPMCFGNTLIYEPYEAEIRGGSLNGITVRNMQGVTMIIVHFKLDGIIVCTKIISSVDELVGNNVEIVSDQNWNSHDIEMYSNGKLIYLKRDIMYMGKLDMGITTYGRSYNIELDKLGVDFVVEENTYSERIIVEEDKENLKEIIDKSNNEIKQKIFKNRLDSSFLFIKPGEIKKAMNYIYNEIRRSSDEIWIFDPYFADEKGIYSSIDWIRILVFCNTTARHIVFFNKIKEESINSYLTPDEFVRIVKSDKEIKKKKGNDIVLGINFYQISTYIHDRFIFIKKEDVIECITIGTSLNSLNSNYYSIKRLSHTCSKSVFDELKKLTNNNIISQNGL